MERVRPRISQQLSLLIALSIYVLSVMLLVPYVSRLLNVGRELAANLVVIAVGVPVAAFILRRMVRHLG